jgi:hypothetical protein
VTANFVVVSSKMGTGILTTSGFTVYFVRGNQGMHILWLMSLHMLVSRAFDHRIPG